MGIGDAVLARPGMLDDVRIGRAAVVGAGAVVTHSVPAHCAVLGSPCRVIKFIEDKTQEPNLRSLVGMPAWVGQQNAG